MNYYNEFDPKAAAWLRELIRCGHIPAGYVDERSIVDVRACELTEFPQCHFFAGVSGWPLALELGGVPADRPLWTGSVPCQPFSVAGKGLAEADERHLWPAFFRLIGQRLPPIVLGEQVASKAALAWLDGVFADMEGAGYACGASDLPAAGVGSPHPRQRIYWVAHAISERGCGGIIARENAVDADARGQETRPGWLRCGETTEPCPSPLVDGFPGRVGLLRGYGNAIVPPLAAEFIKAAIN